jgi:RHS repeat-associated protein
LAEISNSSGVSKVGYRYDADGIRTKKIVNGINIGYIVDKNREYAQVLEERYGNGELIVSYTYGDDLISQKRGTSVYFYHYDGIGSTRNLTDSNAVVTDSYVYDAYGVLLEKSGSTENDYLYTGEQFDPNIGFYYLRARYMDPETGRFISMDSYAGDRMSPISLHKYLYANCNPIMFTDPSGYFSLGSVMCSITIQGIISAMWSGAFSLLSGNSITSKEFWGDVGEGFVIGAATAAVGGLLVKLFAPLIRASVTPLLDIVGEMGKVSLRGKAGAARWFAKLSRFFVNTNKTYPKAGDTFIGKILMRAFPKDRFPYIQWDMHHIFVKQAWSRAGSGLQIFTNVTTNEGLRRLGNGLWNLIPLPSALHQLIHSVAWGPQVFATAYYSIMAYGPVNALYQFVFDDDE